MDPITQALASLAVARAVRKKLPRFGTAMMVVAGVAPDLDFASYFGGASAFLQFHRSVFHSIVGAAAMACAIAGGFWWVARRLPREVAALRFRSAFAVCCAGAAVHVALDLCDSGGVQLLWPFKTRWYAWDIAPGFDPWILAMLLAGILLPHLFRLVSEEIGERKRSPAGGRAAVITLALVAAFLGARADLHGRAVALLLSHEYHGREPLAAAAFPTTFAPWEWRGIVGTDNTIEEADVRLGPDAHFDPDRSFTHYKPEDSPALEAGKATAITRRFLDYAQFPLASVTRVEDGYRFEARDLRCAAGSANPANIIVRVDLNSSLEVTGQELRFASSAGP